MKFPVKFTRAKPATTFAALGSDTIPANDAPPDATKDNLLAVRVTSINGWPPHRVALVCRYTGGAPSPKAINVQLFFFEAATGAWFPTKTAVDSIVPNGAPIFFDMVVPIDMPNVNKDNSMGPGNFQAVLIATDPGGGGAADNGQYDFALAVDLTTG